MLLSEILDKPAHLYWQPRTVDEDDSIITIRARATIGGREIVFALDQLRTGHWELTFSELDDDTGEENFDKTGNGAEFEVFATAKEFLIQCIDQVNPDSIRFTSNKNEASRSKLYKRMVQRFTLPGYHKTVSDNSQQDVFRFEKI